MKKRTKKPSKTTSTRKISTETNKILIENFVNLQKVFTNLATKLDNLSDNITKLLQLFEISARSFAEKQELGSDKEFLDKLNTLMDQNKTIAKGLTLMEEKLKHRVYGNEIEPRERPRHPLF